MRHSHARRSLIHPLTHLSTWQRRTALSGRLIASKRSQHSGERGMWDARRWLAKGGVYRITIGCAAREGGTRNVRRVRGTRRGRVACFVCAFLLSRVCPAARRERGCLMQMKRTMCLNSRRVFIYAIRFIIFHRHCLFLPCTSPRTEHVALLLLSPPPPPRGINRSSMVSRNDRASIREKTASVRRRGRHRRRPFVRRAFDRW